MCPSNQKSDNKIIYFLVYGGPYVVDKDATGCQDSLSFHSKFVTQPALAFF